MSLDSKRARQMAKDLYEMAKRYSDAGDDKTARQLRKDADFHLKTAKEIEEVEKRWFGDTQTTEEV